jgi:enoyl-CoA hydratase/carnithine racemase
MGADASGGGLAGRRYVAAMGSHIRYDVDGGIATITIDRPEKKNAMTYAMLEEFLDAVARAGTDDAARAVVVTGVPGAFCAGTDLADLATVPGDRRGLRGEAGERDRWWPIVSCPKPVIAAIDGPAVGMGAEFTSQCDVRLCSPRARFAWNFVHRGLVPDTGAGTWLLPRLVGLQHALRLLYTGEFMDAEEALTLGYVLAVVPSDGLLDSARQLAGRMLTGSPHSQNHIKRLVYEGLGSPVDEHMARHTEALAACFRSDDHREGVAAFLERRPAVFTGH